MQNLNKTNNKDQPFSVPNPRLLTSSDGVGWVSVVNGENLFYFDLEGGRSNSTKEKFPADRETLRSWYPDGSPRFIGYRLQGRQHGQQIGWFSNGNLRILWNWKHGEFHGRWMDWYENGVTKFQGHYRDGEKHGLWWEWYENGRLSVAAKFDHGNATRLKVWKPNGEPCPESWLDCGEGCWVSYENDGTESYRTTIIGGRLES